MNYLCIFTRKHARVLCIYRFNKVRLELLSYLKSVSHILPLLGLYREHLRLKFVFLVHCLLVVVSCI